MYVKVSCMSRASSPQPDPPTPVPRDDATHKAYGSYVVRNESTVLGGVVSNEPAARARRASSFSRLDLQYILDRLTNIIGENVGWRREEDNITSASRS